MFSLARMDQFRNDLVIEELVLSDLVKKVVQENKRLFVQNKVFPELKLSDDITVITDRKWISFVIEQLIHNAVKYSDAGSNFTVKIWQDDGRVHLAIRDWGIGIRKRGIPRIFELYYTGDNGRDNDQSSGIGLYMVKIVLNELGHKISVRSEVGNGTTITIDFS